MRSANRKNQGGIRLLRISTVWTVLIAALAILVVVAVAIGSAGYSFDSIVHTLYAAVTGQTLSNEEKTILVVVTNLRLPRVVLAILVGAALSSAGALLQAVMRNPLADPGTIGVSGRCRNCRHNCFAYFPQSLHVLTTVCFHRSSPGVHTNLRACLEGRCGSCAYHFIGRGNQFCVGGI